MGNERGVTLVELLATLAIGTLVISLAFMTYKAVQLEWNSTSYQQIDGSQARLVLDTMTRYISNATNIKLVSDRDSGVEELRFITSKDELKSFFYRDQKLILYDLDRTIGLSDEQQDYQNGIELASNLISAPEWNYDQINKTLHITLRFSFTTFDINGRAKEREKVYETTIKQLKY